MMWCVWCSPWNKNTLRFFQFMVTLFFQALVLGLDMENEVAVAFHPVSEYSDLQIQTTT